MSLSIPTPDLEELHLSGRLINYTGHITLNRPKALNALSLDMIQALDHHLNTWTHEDHVQWILLTSVTERAFCAGGDIRAVYQAKQKGDHNFEDAIFRQEYQLNRRIHHFSKPYISLLQGIAMGGGLGISVHGSHRIVTENATLAMPETGIGFFPDVGATYFLNQCPGRVGLYLGLTGERLSGHEAMAFGLATHMVPQESLEKIQKALLAAPLQQDAYGYVDDILDTYRLEAHGTSFEEKLPFIETHFHASSLSALMTSLEQDDHPQAQAILHTLLAKSPTSLAITFLQLTEAKDLSFDDIMKREFRLSQRFIKDHDFCEGIRALLIDKDQTPHWSPAHWQHVDPDHCQTYFYPLGEQELETHLC